MCAVRHEYGVIGQGSSPHPLVTVVTMTMMLIVEALLACGVAARQYLFQCVLFSATTLDGNLENTEASLQSVQACENSHDLRIV